MAQFNVTVYKEVKVTLTVEASNSKEAIEKAHDCAISAPENYRWEDVPDTLVSDEGLDVEIVPQKPVEPKLPESSFASYGYGYVKKI